MCSSTNDNEVVEEKGVAVGMEEEMRSLLGPEYPEVFHLGPDINSTRVSVPRFQNPSPCGAICLVSRALSIGTISCAGPELCPTYQEWFIKSTGQ